VHGQILFYAPAFSLLFCTVRSCFCPQRDARPPASTTSSGAGAGAGRGGGMSSMDAALQQTRTLKETRSAMDVRDNGTGAGAITGWGASAAV
jgi:hypothetical protein